MDRRARLAAAVTALGAVAALVACGRRPLPRPSLGEQQPPGVTEREVARLSAELVAAPKGVATRNGGPYCALKERTGGTHGAPRYVVELVTEDRGRDLLLTRRRDPRPVFYELEVESGGRRFNGLVTANKAFHAGSPTSFVAPTILALRFPGTEMSPADWYGVQEVHGDLTACRLTIVPAEDEALRTGGRRVKNTDSLPVVLDPAGTPRPFDLR